jgi:hypothetical protein
VALSRVPSFAPFADNAVRFSELIRGWDLVTTHSAIADCICGKRREHSVTNGAPFCCNSNLSFQERVASWPGSSQCAAGQPTTRRPMLQKQSKRSYMAEPCAFGFRGQPSGMRAMVSDETTGPTNLFSSCAALTGR